MDEKAEMTLKEKFDYCLTYCRDMYDVSNGEILEGLTEADFDEMDTFIAVTLKD